MRDKEMEFLQELFSEELKKRPQRWLNVPEGFSSRDLQELPRNEVTNVIPSKKERTKKAKTKKCLHCGKIFEPTHSTQKYCTPECRDLHRLEKMRAGKPQYTYNCQQCGKPFTTYRRGQKFCSKECRYFSEKRRVLSKQAIENIKERECTLCTDFEHCDYIKCNYF